MRLGGVRREPEGTGGKGEGGVLVALLVVRGQGVLAEGTALSNGGAGLRGSGEARGSGGAARRSTGRLRPVEAIVVEGDATRGRSRHAHRREGQARIAARRGDGDADLDALGLLRLLLAHLVTMLGDAMRLVLNLRGEDDKLEGAALGLVAEEVLRLEVLLQVGVIAEILGGEQRDG